MCYSQAVLKNEKKSLLDEETRGQQLFALNSHHE